MIISATSAREKLTRLSNQRRNISSRSSPNVAGRVDVESERYTTEKKANDRLSANEKLSAQHAAVCTVFSFSLQCSCFLVSALKWHCLLHAAFRQGDVSFFLFLFFFFFFFSFFLSFFLLSLSFFFFFFFWLCVACVILL